MAWSGIMLSNELNDGLVSESRKSDRVMSIELATSRSPAKRVSG